MGGAVEKELSVIGGAIAESPKFAAFLENPFISGEEKLSVLAPALDSASGLTKNTLSQKMSTAEINALKKDPETNYLAKGETLELTTEVDSSILGGYIIEIGDKYLDLSLSTRLESMHQLLQESI